MEIDTDYVEEYTTKQLQDRLAICRQYSQEAVSIRFELKCRQYEKECYENLY